MNIPEVKLGIIAVSRDCFPIALSRQRRKNIVAAYGEGIYECPITVENEKDALAALADVKANGVNALVVFLGNFGPETPETLLVKKFLHISVQMIEYLSGRIHVLVFINVQVHVLSAITHNTWVILFTHNFCAAQQIILHNGRHRNALPQ